MLEVTLPGYAAISHSSEVSTAAVLVKSRGLWTDAWQFRSGVPGEEAPQGQTK